MCVSEHRNKTEMLWFPKCQFLPANHTHNIHKYSQEKGKQKKKRTRSIQTAVAAFWLMGLILRKSRNPALNSVCMCVGQIKKCQSSRKHYYTLPHLFSIKKVFSSYLPLPSKEKQKKSLVVGREIKLLDWVFLLSCPALRNFDDLLHTTHFHHTKHHLQHLCDYLIKSLNTKVLIVR